MIKNILQKKLPRENFVRYIQRLLFIQQVPFFLVLLIFVFLGFFNNWNLLIKQIDLEAQATISTIDTYLDGFRRVMKSFSFLLDDEEELKRLDGKYRALKAIYKIDSSGRLEYSIPKDDRFFPGMDMSGWTQQGNQDLSELGQAFFSAKTDKTGLYGSYETEEGSWILVDLDIEFFQSWIETRSLSGINYSILDTQGRYIASKNFSLVNNGVYLDHFKSFQSSKNGTWTYADGKMVFTLLSPLNTLHAWLLSQVDIFSLINPYLWISFWALIFSALWLVTTLLIQNYQIKKRILNPLFTLEKESRDLAAQGLLKADTGETITSPILEISNLSHGFSLMRQQLEDKQKRLLQTMENLEERNRDMENFSYAVSHDLRAPLITIKGFMAYLKEAFEAKDADAFEADYKRVMKAAETMENMLKDVLYLSKVRRQDEGLAMVELSECVQEAIELLGAYWQDAGVKPIIESKLPAIAGDKVLLVEMFQNLLENSWKYRKPQEPLSIHIGCIDQNTVYIEDKGSGFSPEQKDRIFRLFERLDLKKEGTGVGLAVVKRIVELHKGTIEAYSAGPGQGARFTLHFNPREEQI